MEKINLGPQPWLFPMPALLVGTLVDGKPDFMTAAWAGIACSDPPLLSVAVRPARLTLRGIREEGVFSVNVPRASQAKEVDFCGVHSGKKVDKSKVFTVFYGKDPKIPLAAECPVGLECGVVRTIELGSHVLVIGRILESHVDSDCAAGGRPVVEKIDPLVFAVGANAYYRLGERAGDAFRG
jgi:flavin reductase (DIM6/NTAB) family NADH-FMN oxidoreductase RutF